MNHQIKLLTLSLILVVTGGVAWAQFAKPDDAIAYRKAVMQVIGKHFGEMADMVKGSQPYAQDAFEKDARIVALMAALPWEASLVPGSYDGGGTTLKEDALRDREGFMAAAQEFEAASQDLLTAAQGGDQGAIKSTFGATAKSCSRCHKTYRK